MRIAFYARVSTKDKGQDHENQLRELREFVSRKASDGWTLAHEYVDKASWNSGDRPAFRRLLEDASRWEFELVLFWSLDRRRLVPRAPLPTTAVNRSILQRRVGAAARASGRTCSKIPL
jgi:DNA invertase Pin-like site-specific DNA recombinase